MEILFRPCMVFVNVLHQLLEVSIAQPPQFLVQRARPALELNRFFAVIKVVHAKFHVLPIKYVIVVEIVCVLLVPTVQRSLILLLIPLVRNVIVSMVATGTDLVVFIALQVMVLAQLLMMAQPVLL
jgi:hypothetical protein